MLKTESSLFAYQKKSLMHRFAIIEAPSILGLRPTGVEMLPEAMKSAGLYDALKARIVQRVDPPPYVPKRDPETLLLNSEGLLSYSRLLAGKVADLLLDNNFPVVLGGDCSNLIGCALALRRAGRYGLFFFDGHADFFQPEAEPNGEAASMDLAIVSGRGPGLLADIDGLGPFIRDEDIVAFAYRDLEDQRRHGSQDISATPIHTFPLEQMRVVGVLPTARTALCCLDLNLLKGLWIHIDADVLNDSIMPAVDYRMPGGLEWEELSGVLQVLMTSANVVGANIGIFNPLLDETGTVARRFSLCLAEGLTNRLHSVKSV